MAKRLAAFDPTLGILVDDEATEELARLTEARAAMEEESSRDLAGLMAAGKLPGQGLRHGVRPVGRHHGGHGRGRKGGGRRSGPVFPGPGRGHRGRGGVLLGSGWDRRPPGVVAGPEAGPIPSLRRSGSGAGSVAVTLGTRPGTWW